MTQRAAGDPQAGLSPAQERVVSELFAIGQPRPRFDPGLAARLRAEMEQALTGVAEDVGDGQMWVDKRSLAQVHACQQHWLSERDRDGFGWSARTAAGSVVHRAIELSVSCRHEAVAMELVDHAIATLSEDLRRTSPRPWLLKASDFELAELRGRAHDTVVKFQECWPRLRPSWAPRTETGIGAELCGGRILLWGKVDLVLGVARGDEARCLIVDLKTGRSYATHLDDLRFYALVQTLRIGVPPFRVASYYLDTATFHPEDVTEPMLEVAVRRVVDGIRAMARLVAGPHAAELSPGPTCSWCRLSQECPGAAGYQSSREEDEDFR